MPVLRMVSTSPQPDSVDDRQLGFRVFALPSSCLPAMPSTSELQDDAGPPDMLPGAQRVARDLSEACPLFA